MSRPKTPTTDQIRAWIDNSDLLGELPSEDENSTDDVSKAIDSSCLLTDLQDKLDYYIQESYDEGFEDGEWDKEENITAENLSESLKEEVGCTFTVDKFKDCKTLEDFQREYAYIYSDSLTFMK